MWQRKTSLKGQRRQEQRDLAMLAHKGPDQRPRVARMKFELYLSRVAASGLAGTARGLGNISGHPPITFGIALRREPLLQLRTSIRAALEARTQRIGCRFRRANRGGQATEHTRRRTR